MVKWGNSSELQISSSIMKLAQRTADQAVSINVLKGKSSSNPSHLKNTRLDNLLAEITPDNIHDEVSFGIPVGKEIL